jgi:hypothetical protein
MNILSSSELIFSVLVIDEAYGLYSENGVGGSGDPYKTAVINTIVEQVQNVPGEDRCVIMLGYRNEMEKMLKNSNPGLQRRFQLVCYILLRASNLLLGRCSSV